MQYYNHYFLENINDKLNVQDNVEITDPKMIANAFNNYFTNIGNNLANLDNIKSKIPITK
jgi:hypothetical protein